VRREGIIAGIYLRAKKKKGGDYIEEVKNN